jgi:hypothetical protein
MQKSTLNNGTSQVGSPESKVGFFAGPHWVWVDGPKWRFWIVDRQTTGEVR